MCANNKHQFYRFPAMFLCKLDKIWRRTHPVHSKVKCLWRKLAKYRKNVIFRLFNLQGSLGFNGSVNILESCDFRSQFDL